MKRPMTLVREIESIQATIAERRRDRARIDDEISDLVAINKTKLMALVEAALERLDVSKVPAQTLMLSLSQVMDDAIHKTMSSPDVALQAFMRFGRNASPANREKLVAAGLHWHGREGGWVGQVTEAQIANLRDTFGGRLKKPEAVRAQDDPGVSPGGAQEPLSSNMETIVTSSEDGQRPATTAFFSKDVDTSRKFPPPPAGFPVRRQPVT